MKIKLAEDTIEYKELENLCSWILSGNRLTKSTETLIFEQEFSAYVGSKYAVMTNSGSSSNLLMASALLQSGRLKSNKVIAPAVSWVTTVTPFMQLGFDVVLCDCDQYDLGLNTEEFERLCREERPAVAIVVHVLGHSNSMSEIIGICQKYDVILLEDSCESLGSEALGKKLGTLSTAGSYSFYYGHHISTIEGGMVVTDDYTLYELMLSIRSHGWSRDLSSETAGALAEEFDIDEFRNLYTFYYSGFNLRSTDLQAHIGRSQLHKLTKINCARDKNFKLYQTYLSDYFVQKSKSDFVSSFAYGTLVENRIEVAKTLQGHGIEVRPLICGNIARHPFWLKINSRQVYSNADLVHDYGLYLPNHLNMSDDDVRYCCEIFKSVAIPKHFE